jgi:hypothetical protein
MKNKNAWITVSLVNLVIVALLGFSLRTKFIFPIPFLDYRNLISAHSHFAFGGWVTLVLMVLFIENCLAPQQKQQKAYQVILWGILLSSYGMLLTFPFQGYAAASIVFSTLFILFTYAFSWFFIRDVLRSDLSRPVLILIIGALSALVISSIGPFWLAYMMSSHSGNATNMRDAVYTYLHFQYNGFFTLSVFALLFHRKMDLLSQAARKRIRSFAIVLCLSVVPSLFLSLLWHYYNLYLRVLAYVGCGLILFTLFCFIRIPYRKERVFSNENKLVSFLLSLSIASFFIKMVLQTGTIIPWLGNAVFGYRPIIIGFLHLVFLGFVTFYVLSLFLEEDMLNPAVRMSRFAILYFSIAVILNEAILFIDGLGRLFRKTNPIYDQLLWLVSIGLFTGAIFLLAARIKSMRCSGFR